MRVKHTKYSHCSHATNVFHHQTSQSFSIPTSSFSARIKMFPKCIYLSQRMHTSNVSAYSQIAFFVCPFLIVYKFARQQQYRSIKNIYTNICHCHQCVKGVGIITSKEHTKARAIVRCDHLTANCCHPTVPVIEVERK